MVVEEGREGNMGEIVETRISVPASSISEHLSALGERSCLRDLDIEARIGPDILKELLPLRLPGIETHRKLLLKSWAKTLWPQVPEATTARLQPTRQISPCPS
jgi:hypothetical protein